MSWRWATKAWAFACEDDFGRLSAHACEQLKITIAESVAHDRKVVRHFSCALSEQRRRDNGGFVFVEAFGQFATRHQCANQRLLTLTERAHVRDQSVPAVMRSRPAASAMASSSSSNSSAGG